MRSLTSSRPAWSRSRISRACTGSSFSSECFDHGTAISQSRYERIMLASPDCSPMRSSRPSSLSACSRTSSGMPASSILVRYSSTTLAPSSPSSRWIDSICLRRKYSRCCWSAPDWTSSRMRRRTCSSVRRSRWSLTASSRRSVTSTVSRTSDLLLEGDVGRVADGVGQGAGLGDGAQERADALVGAARLEDLLDDGAVLALEITGAPVDRDGVGSLLDLDAQAAEGIGAGGAGDAAHLAGEGHGAAAAGQPDAIGDVRDRPDLGELRLVTRARAARARRRRRPRAASRPSWGTRPCRRGG